MKTYRFTIDGTPYEVVVDDIHARPIQVSVNGHMLSVHPEQASALPSASIAPPSAPLPSPRAVPSAAEAGISGAVRAPIPGVVLELHVEVGDHVEAGDELLVLEAMKMKNVIRAPQRGVVAAIHAQLGQQVQHQAPLIDLELA